jgi:hypothetical protein
MVLPQRRKLGPLFGRQRLENADLLLDVGERHRGIVLRLLGPSGDAVEQGFEAFVHAGQVTM